MSEFNGLGMHLGNLSRLSSAQSRSISAENPTGARGEGARATEGAGAEAARDLGPGWKVAPAIVVAGGASVTIADIEGPGAIQQMWFTITGQWRSMILRAYWDGQEAPSIECPLGDFFASGWQDFGQISSLAVCHNPSAGFACYWEMPFRAHARITVENIDPTDAALFYQINYALTEVPDDAAYFHAQFRRNNPLAYLTPHTLLDGVEGRGHYVGTSLAWGSNTSGWWGEGEMHFFLDGEEHPTIAGTGLEDYFCGAWGFNVEGRYRDFTSPYTGFRAVLPDGKDPNRSQSRFAMYRWHIVDPVRFTSQLKVTVQGLGWRKDLKRYLPLRDDVSSVAYWYQTLPTAPFPPLPGRDDLEII